MVRRFFSALALLWGVCPAGAQGVSVSDAYARATPPSARTGAAFLTLHGGAAEDRLIAAESPLAARAEIHAAVADEKGVVGMRKIAESTIPAGGRVVFAPGGPHVMLIGLREPLKAGETAPLILRFASGAEVAVEAPILSPRELRGRSGAHGEARGGHGGGP